MLIKNESRQIEQSLAVGLAGQVALILEGETRWNTATRNLIYFGLGPQFAQYNPYSYTITANWSVTVSGSVTVSASAGVSADLNAIVAGVKADVNGGVSFTVGVSGTEGVFVPVQPHTWVYGQFSIERQKAYGHLYYATSSCTINPNYGTVESWTPWHLW